ANDMNFNNLLAWVGGFSFFAFLSTLIREIIKDIEDFEGDSAYGRNTMPILLGIRFTKVLVVVLILAIVVSLIYVYVNFLYYNPGGKPDLISLAWFTIFLIFPFLYLIFRLVSAKEKKDYHLCSNITKLIMLAGILYSVLVYFIIHKYIP
ncbi:MAG: UbiA family prenyltransferase, partial [Bacteroidales bacterium]|nr:UbiA family prenyltransferase [Bacteroidales bacterium]